MKCSDCKGSGNYQGMHAIEDCKLCKGTGEVTIPDHLPEDIINPCAETYLEPAQPEVGHKVFIAKGFDLECEITEVNDSRNEFCFEGGGGRGVAKFDETGWNTNDGRWEVL